MAAYAVLGNFVTAMVARGKPPSVYKAIHLKDARDYNHQSSMAAEWKSDRGRQAKGENFTEQTHSKDDSLLR